jgi:hypothetical protein
MTTKVSGSRIDLKAHRNSSLAVKNDNKQQRTFEPVVSFLSFVWQPEWRMKVAMKQYGFWLTAWIVLGLLGGRVEGKIQLTEEARLVEYEKRNYTWPFEHYTPQTAGWKTLYDERLRQVEEMEGLGTRYEGFIQTLNSGLLVPNFTEHGFGLARCPDDLLAALQDGIRKGLPTATLEREVEVITGPRCKFINRPDLTDRVLQELRHYAETWAGIPLTPYRAYGFRVYQNDSRLFMHVDKMQTHIVSFILHIDSSEDAGRLPTFVLRGRFCFFSKFHLHGPHACCLSLDE